MKQKLLMNHVKRIGWLSVVLLFVVQITYGQRSSVTGVVKDEAGQTLPGVNVMIPGTTTGTVTDANGTYSIEAPSDGELQYSFIGYTSVTVKIEGRSSIDVQLKEDVTSLQEVVVVGYGTQKKSDLTGSVGSATSKDLTQIATPDVVGALSGRIAGVNITAQSGEPGGGNKIRIRGITSINNSDPIYVVDGFQVGDISYLNPNDIESMDILKDASATAIYGSRGAAGVVLITTKKSKSNTTKVIVDGYVGLQQLPKKLDLVNAAEYATLRMEAYENDGTPLSPDGDLYTRLAFVKDGGYKGTDWQKEITQQAPIQNYSASIIGGSEKHKFNISGTYFNQQGIVKETGMQKVFFRVNNDFNFTKWLDAGIDLSYMNLDKTNYSNDLYAGSLPVAARVDPVTPAWDIPSNNWGRPDISQNNNPARTTNELKHLKYYENFFIANMYAQAKLSKNFTLRSQFGGTFKSGRSRNYYPKFFIATDEARDISSLSESRNENSSWMWTNYLTFNKAFGDHSVNAMAGVEMQLVSRYRSISATGFDVPLEPDLQYLSAAKSTDDNIGSGQSEQTIESYFARANYSYKGKYLLTGTIRFDASSKFESVNYWSSFPSFSLGWNIAEESFMTSIPQITTLKLRGGWGQVGNSNSVGPYRTVTTFNNGQQTSFNGKPVQGSASLFLSNPELKWETSQMTSVGLDVGLFNNKLTLVAEYFERKTIGMLFEIPIPTYAGTGKPSANALSMKGSGLELSLGYKNHEKEFTYEFNGNISLIDNEITDLGGSFIASGGVGKVGSTTRTEEGYEIAYFYGLRTDGIFNDQEELDAYVGTEGNAIQPNAKPGDVKYVDKNSDGLIDDKDRTYLGSATPDFTYGMSGTLGYKKFDLRFLLTGSQGNEAVNSITYFNQSSNGLENSRKNRMDRWTPDNTSSNEPRMTNKDLNKNIGIFSDRYVEDGSYLRMKNIQLGYNFPSATLTKWKLSAVRLYISVDNLFTVTKYTGYDPEFGDLYGGALNYGVDQATYPNPRIFRAGVNLKL